MAGGCAGERRLRWPSDTSRRGTGVQHATQTARENIALFVTGPCGRRHVSQEAYAGTRSRRTRQSVLRYGLTTSYQQLEFGKHAMLRAMFGKFDPQGFGTHFAEEERKLDEKLLGKAPAGSSAHTPATKSTGLAATVAAWVNADTALSCVGLILGFLAGVYVVVYRS